MNEQTEQKHEDDLYLRDLRQFIGTEKYTSMAPLFKTLVTNGIVYVMQNGYSWLVTDALAVIDSKFRDKEFISVKLKRIGSGAIMTIEDGNLNIYYQQEYERTDAKVDLNMYWMNNVLMLPGEN